MFIYAYKHRCNSIYYQVIFWPYHPIRSLAYIAVIRSYSILRELITFTTSPIDELLDTNSKF